MASHCSLPCLQCCSIISGLFVRQRGISSHWHGEPVGNGHPTSGQRSLKRVGMKRSACDRPTHARCTQTSFCDRSVEQDPLISLPSSMEFCFMRCWQIMKVASVLYPASLLLPTWKQSLILTGSRCSAGLEFIWLGSVDFLFMDVWKKGFKGVNV